MSYRHRHRTSRQTARRTSPIRSSHGRRDYSNMNFGGRSGENALQATARETLRTLPSILGQLGASEAAVTAHKYSPRSVSRLDPNACPSISRPATIRVINEDTLNAANQLSLTLQQPQQSHVGGGSGGQSQLDNSCVMIVNFANEEKPGGGWLNGRMAQEESICYRSSLAYSLDKRQYPLEWDEIIYSPYVLVVRESLAEGHRLYDINQPEAFPSFSCVTVAAVRQPQVRTFPLRDGGDGRHHSREKHTFASDRDRSITKIKMRQTLRAAAIHGNHSLLLGALGCGVYANPVEDVAHCWLEVFREDEFSGHWWQDVWFAVYDPRGDGNFATFQNVLDGQEV